MLRSCAARSPSDARPLAVSNVPVLVLVLKVTRSADSRAVGDTSRTLPLATNSPVRTLNVRSSAKICWPFWPLNSTSPMNRSRSASNRSHANCFVSHPGTS
nr:hypothetical protein [uncultured bacterium]